MTKQKINLINTDNRCSKDQPRTLFFYNKFTNRRKLEKWLKENNRTIEEIELTDEKYFLTYQIKNNPTYFYSIKEALSSNNFCETRDKHWYSDNFVFSFWHYKPEYVYWKIKSPYLKLGIFPFYRQISNKDKLYRHYMGFQEKFPNDYNFIMKTYIYPLQKKEIENKFMNYSFSKDNLWLIKPQSGSLGRGIHFFKSLKSEKKEKYLITKYISEPHLLRGTKYDLRIYVLVTSFLPLKIYLYKEGLVRLASEKYSLEDTDNKFIHLTNVAINKKNKEGYKPSKDSSSEDYDKWNLETYKKYLLKHYPEKPNLYEDIRKQIKDVVIKSIICGQKEIILGIKNKFEASNFFQIFGFDILLEKNFTAHLLEVNGRPQLTLADKVDEIVKLNLLTDTLNIVGITSFNKLNRTESLDKNISKEILKDKVQRAVENSLCEFYRPMGNYERIFPLKENIDKYKKFFTTEDNEYNDLLWKEMLNS